jgi:hypothetical protein
VRKSFLDAYRGDVVYIDCPATDGPEVLSPDRIRRAALDFGRRMSPADVECWSVLLKSRNYRAAMANTHGAAAAEPVHA